MGFLRSVLGVRKPIRVSEYDTYATFADGADDIIGQLQADASAISCIKEIALHPNQVLLLDALTINHSTIGVMLL